MNKRQRKKAAKKNHVTDAFRLQEGKLTLHCVDLPFALRPFVSVDYKAVELMVAAFNSEYVWTPRSAPGVDRAAIKKRAVSSQVLNQENICRCFKRKNGN